MWERSVHIPLGGENVVIYQLSSCLKNSVFNRILSIVCAMKFAFMIYNRGKAKLMLLCSNKHFVAYSIPGKCCTLFSFGLVLHLECLIIDAYFNIAFLFTFGSYYFH